MKAVLNESNRLLFAKGFGVWFRHNRHRFSTALLFFVLFSAFGLYFVDHTNRTYQKGIADGAKQALDTRQPSEELDAACAALWVGEQNKKYLLK